MRYLIFVLSFIFFSIAAGQDTKLRVVPAPCIVERGADGIIKRSETVRNQFRTLYPCPKYTDDTKKRCYYFIEHVHSLGLCGADHVANLAWTTPAQHYAKGRWELSSDWRRRLVACKLDEKRVLTCPGVVEPESK